MGYDPSAPTPPIQPVTPDAGASKSKWAAYRRAFEDWYVANVEYQKARLIAQPGGVTRLNVGGTTRQMGRDVPACDACLTAQSDRENPRDHCAAHDHVIRQEAP